MKKLSIVVFCLFSKMVFSQVDAPQLPPKIDTIKPTIQCYENEVIFINPALNPEFEGGELALYKFIKENLRWPMPDVCAEGTIFVGFTITTKGELIDFKIKRGFKLEAYNAEAIRVIKLTNGKWKAGRLNGKAVDVNYMIPIKFKLE